MQKTEKRDKFFTKFDLIAIGTALLFFLLLFVMIKFVFQKEKYVEVEMLVSGGEWWWGTAPPYYWNINPLDKGAIEYDVFHKPLVEILEVNKYNAENRQVALVKARIQVKENIRTHVYSFKQTQIQIGKTISIAPNNISIMGYIVKIDGVGELGSSGERIITGKIYSVREWQTDIMKVGDMMKTNEGEVLAEIIDKKVEPAQEVTNTWQGELLEKRSPVFKDVTLTVRIKVNTIEGQDYFAFYQMIKKGSGIHLQLSNAILDPYVADIKDTQESLKTK